MNSRCVVRPCLLSPRRFAAPRLPIRSMIRMLWVGGRQQRSSAALHTTNPRPSWSVAHSIIAVRCITICTNESKKEKETDDRRTQVIRSRGHTRGTKDRRQQQDAKAYRGQQDELAEMGATPVGSFSTTRRLVSPGNSSRKVWYRVAKSIGPVGTVISQLVAWFLSSISRAPA